MDSAVCQSFHDKCWLHHFGWFRFEGKWEQNLCFFNRVETQNTALFDFGSVLRV